MSEQQLTATHRVPFSATKNQNWLLIRSDIVNHLVTHLWSSGRKLVGDVSIEEETITDAKGVPLWHEFRARCTSVDHDF